MGIIIISERGGLFHSSASKQTIIIAIQTISVTGSEVINFLLAVSDLIFYEGNKFLRASQSFAYFEYCQSASLILSFLKLPMTVSISDPIPALYSPRSPRLTPLSQTNQTVLPRLTLHPVRSKLTMPRGCPSLVLPSLLTPTSRFPLLRCSQAKGFLRPFGTFQLTFLAPARPHSPVQLLRT